ncbi:hypothetical protein ACFLQ2_01855 [archaeon]
MMKASTFLIGSLLLMAVACAASLDVDNRHVFEGEEFTVKYTASAPLSQQEVSIAFADQEKSITLPSMAVGTFSTTIEFTAPQRGTYEVVSGEARAVVEVEPAMVVLEDVRVEPSSVSPGDSVQLSYTIRNDGDVKAYHVKRKITIASDAFSYNSEEDELYGEMGPGASLHEVKEIMARESASGDVNIQLTVSYEFDNEVHRREEWVRLGVSAMDLWMVAAVLVVIAAAGLFFSKTQRAGE